ncbi:MAG TPA: efflux RND transporter periplasmic adaptor subunit [Candidatus Acidoferrales bacterium]|nr:efflux RND transporter periplasmic adaptor subunit [Candidatus Acidoferrales bacterium]
MHDILSKLRAKKIFVIPLVAICVFLIVRTLLLQQPNPEIDYTVKQENLVDTVQVSGTYTTAAQTQVVSPAKGIITQLYVKNGEYVKKGAPLFHVESTATIDELESAYADYENALSALQTAQNNVQSLDATMWTKQQAYISAQNTQKYMNNNSINTVTKQNYTDLEKLSINNAVTQTQKDFQAAEQTYNTAGVAVTAAQAKVTQTKQAYDETKSTTVTSPASGTVVNLEENVGDEVTAPKTAVTIKGTSSGQASISSTTPQAVLVIANLSDPYISASISEDYAARVMPGQKASIVFDSLKDRTFTGTVQNIDTVGTTTDGVVTYSARIVADSITSNIKPNMTALITIETLRKDDVIDVPNSAIIIKEGNTYVINANTHQQIPVTLGTKGIAKTEITGGLTTGTVIVANPN